MAPIPIVSSLVHYVSHGTPPRPDGTQAYASQCRAAIVAGIDRDGIELCVLNPSGIFFQKVEQDELTHAPGTCHWGTSFCPASDPRTFAVPKMVEPAPGEPVEIASLPAEVRTLIHAVDQMCDGWAEAGEIQRHALWQAVHAANAAVWNH